MKRVIIMGSPRSSGRSAHLAEMLFEASIDERPEDELFLVPVSEVEIGPCIGCGACREETEVTFADDDGGEVVELRHRCIFDDDMQTLYDLLDEADELVIVSPVYFSGTPAPMKCVLDRMQPYFWVTQWGLTKEEARALPKRPAALHVVGEGGDPHGFEPLVGEVKSSLACAGFRLERVLNWVGKISESGEILAEATEVEPARAQAGGATSLAGGAQAGGAASLAGGAAAGEATALAGGAAAGERPKLDLAAGRRGNREAASNNSGKSRSAKRGAGQKGGAPRRKGKSRG